MGVRLGVCDGVPNARFDFREERSRDKAELSSGSCDKTKRGHPPDAWLKRRYMSSPNNSPADGSSIRDFWLGQVSEAANALAGTRVLSNTPPATKVSTEPIEPTKSISPSVRPDDSFNPAVDLAKSQVRSSPQLTIFICLMTTLAVATTILLVTGELSPNGIRQWLTSVIDGFSTAAERTKPRLIIQPSYGTVGEPAPLGLAVQGLVEEAVVYIEGLLPGMEFQRAFQSARMLGKFPQLSSITPGSLPRKVLLAPSNLLPSCVFPIIKSPIGRR